MRETGLAGVSPSHPKRSPRPCGTTCSRDTPMGPPWCSTRASIPAASRPSPASSKPGSPRRRPPSVASSPPGAARPSASPASSPKGRRSCSTPMPCGSRRTRSQRGSRTGPTPSTSPIRSQAGRSGSRPSRGSRTPTRPPPSSRCWSTRSSWPRCPPPCAEQPAPSRCSQRRASSSPRSSRSPRPRSRPSSSGGSCWAMSSPGTLSRARSCATSGAPTSPQAARPSCCSASRASSRRAPPPRPSPFCARRATRKQPSPCCANRPSRCGCWGSSSSSRTWSRSSASAKARTPA
ncbi:hypothetical protein D3C86_1133570 [compost metagenome]